jgi:hypothetical protein
LKPALADGGRESVSGSAGKRHEREGEDSDPSVPMTRETVPSSNRL